MVKRLLVFLAAAAAVLELCSCTLFSDTLFPEFLSGVVASRELSDKMDDLIQGEELDWDADVGVLRDAAGTDYVFVLVWGFRGSRIVALDSNLRVLGSFDNQPYGRRLMTDASNQFVLGEVVLANPPTSIAPLSPLSTSVSADVPGFSARGTNNYLLWTNTSTAPNTLEYQTFTGTWVPGTLKSVPVEAAYTGNWFLYGAAYDPQRPTDQEVVLLLRREQDSSLHVLFVPLLLFESSLPDNLTGTYPGFTISIQKPRRVHYTRRGIVVRSEEDRESAVFGLDGKRIADLDTEGRHDLRGDYDLSGQYFYYLDRDARILFKGRTAW
jgi:hypothetical protein